jgi:signal transduction histidine kinase
MRLLPRSMAGRIVLVLIAGVCLTLLASVAVLSPDPFGSGGSPPFIQTTERVASLASVVDRAPAAIRRQLLPAIGDADLEAVWSPDGRPPPALASDWASAHLEEHLQEVLGRHGLAEVMVGRPSDLAHAAPGPIEVWVRLADGSWLTIALRADILGWTWRFRFLLSLAVLAAGIAGLAVWAARRVTAPLGGFAAAAERLGTDVEAPPLDESGASEIGQAARAFNRMQERIRRFVDDRTLMLAAISHDLRTSLTRLKLRTEFIEDAEQREKALADLDEMQAMLDSTLSFARDDSAAEARTRVDLGALLESLCDDLADAGQAVRFEGPERVTLECRPGALRRAFLNLIDNALAYGGEAAVTLADGGKDLVVTVADRGPGVAAEMRERVFSPFFRLEGSRSRDTGGTGLGLAIARSVVRGHGGDVQLGERPGGGLLVEVSLPRTGA